MGHALLSPSSLPDLELCPGKAASVATLLSRPRRSQPSAQRGTVLHDLLAKYMDRQGTSSAMALQQMADVTLPVPNEPGATYTLTVQDLLDVQMVINVYEDRRQTIGPGEFEKRVVPGAAYHRHQFDPLTGANAVVVGGFEEESWGTADAVFHGRGILEVIDAKFGRVYVPEDSLQLVAYLLGALKDIPRTPGEMVQEFRTTIVQPNGEGQRERTKVWTQDELLAEAYRLGAIADKALAYPPVRVPGEKQCRFCDFKPKCPEHTAAMGQRLEELLVDEPTTTGPSLVFDLNTGTMVPAQQPEVTVSAPTPAATGNRLSDLLVSALTSQDDELELEAMVAVHEAAPMLKSWLEGIASQLLARAMKGEQVPGFKVVAGNGKRDWTLPANEMLKKMSNWSRVGEDGKAAGKLKREDYTEVKLITAPQAEKRIKPLVSSKTWGNIEKLIQKTPGKPTLVPESDNRPPLRLSADEALEGEDEEETVDVSNAQVRDEEAPEAPEVPSFLR